MHTHASSTERMTQAQKGSVSTTTSVRKHARHAAAIDAARKRTSREVAVAGARQGPACNGKRETSERCAPPPQLRLVCAMPVGRCQKKCIANK